MGDRLAAIDMDQKLGGRMCPFGEGGTGSPSNTVSPGPRPVVKVRANAVPGP